MDQQLREILQEALANRYSEVLSSIREECWEREDGGALFAQMSRELDCHPALGGEAKRLVQAYLAADDMRRESVQRALYVQGAMDCAAILKELQLL